MNAPCLAIAAVAAVVVAGLALGRTVFAAELTPSGPVSLPDTIRAPEDISGIGKSGDFLIVGSDEATGPDEDENVIQLLSPAGDTAYRVVHDIVLFSGNKEDGREMDIEGIAVEGNTVYVLGSHSAKRSRIKDNKSSKKNRKTFRDGKIVIEKSRDRVYRIELDSGGNAIDGKTKHINLRRLIEDHPVLETFSGIPSKENGVDMEGIAVKEGTLYLGFRGPVFRGNYVPVMKLDFDDPEGSNKLLYVRLGGRGIRSLARVSDGFLIVAGPVGDGPGSYELYHWDGRDMIPGEDRSPDTLGRVRMLGEIRPPEDAETAGKAEGVSAGKAEGLVVLEEDAESYHLIVVYDGIKDNAAERFRVDKNPQP